jgi:hypothetical protein
MSAVEALRAARAFGVSVRIDGDDIVLEAAAPPPPNLIELLSRHKAAILKELRESANATLTAIPAAQYSQEAHRQKVRTVLEAHPTAKYALFSDTETDPEAVIVVLAIRGRATCEIRIPRDKYDGTLLLHLIERHGETIH